MVERRFMCEAATGAGEPCLGLRLCERHDPRRQKSPAADADKCTRECLAIHVARRLGSQEVLETLADVMLVRRIPEYLRSDSVLA